MPDNRERIAQIREILAEGVTSVTRDGSTTNWDLDQLRTELRELEAADPRTAGDRPVLQQINMRRW